MEMRGTLFVLVSALLASGCVCDEVDPSNQEGDPPTQEVEPAIHPKLMEDDDGIKRPDVKDPEMLRWAAMTAENPMRDFGPVFSETIQDLVQTKDDPWVKFMERAAEEKDVFKFTTRSVGGKTELESVNGVVARPEDGTTWAVIFQQVIGDDCRIPQSVDRFFPVDDDHIVVKLMTKGETKKIPICFWPIKEEDTPPPL